MPETEPGRATGSRTAAATLWAIGVALALAAIPLMLVDRRVPMNIFGYRGFDAPLALAFGSVGWIIASRRSRNPIGWMLLVVGLLSGVQIFGSEYATFSYARRGGSLPFTTVLASIQSWIWVIAVSVLVVGVVTLFPDGRPPSRRWRALLIVAPLAVAAFTAMFVTMPGQVPTVPIGVTNPYAASRAASHTLQSVAGPLFFAVLLLSVVALVVRYRDSVGEERQQMKWLASTASVAGVLIVASLAVSFASGGTGSLAVRLIAVGVSIAFVAMASAIGIAVLRRGLYEIDVVISKTLVFAVIAAFITIVYVATVAGVGAAVGRRSNVWLSILATAIVAVAFTPVRNRANRVANRVVFGDRATPYETLSRFGDRMAAATADALPELARLMTEATAAARASVWLAVGGELSPAAVWPAGDAALAPLPLPEDEVVVEGFDRVYPVRHEGELLGALAVATSSAEPLAPAHDKLLTDLAAQAAILMRNGRLIAELQASRQRIVAAADAARRQIERNLHDGAQQHLVALSVKIGLARQLLAADPAAAGTILEELKGDAGEALEALRTLARGIYPPLLADQGLVAALSAQARKTAVPVEVRADGVGRYSQDVEAAVYFCVLEALQNVGKYSGASSAHVRLWAEDGRLSFSVGDDGRGFDAATTARGSGLTNMADRIESLGGHIEFASRPDSGTTVTGWVRATPETPTRTPAIADARNA